VPKLSENSKLYLLSLLVGLGSGLAAVLLESAIRFFKNLIIPLCEKSPYGWLYIAFPALGMLISLLLLRFVVKDNIGHGVTKVLVAISRKESRIKAHNCWSSMLTSAFTIGFGGSVGAEAPIVYTGAAIGSNIGKISKMSYRGITVLVGCGAAGAIAGIFKAPLAGVLFTLEILLFNISMGSMMPLLLSTLTATVVSYLMLGFQTPFSCTLAPFNMANMPFYLVLGLFCGLCSLYFTGTTLWLEDKIAKTIRNHWLRWLLCALGLGVLIMLLPPLYGEGYDSVGALLTGNFSSDKYGSGWPLVLFCLAVMVFKVFAMTFTNSGGGVGGTFGPTLVVGAFAGFVFARAMNICMGDSFSLPEQNFVLVGMAGLMAGVMQAPMTAIFLIAETTGGYDLLLPLMLCSAASFGTTRLRERYSIYTKRIAQSGDLLTHNSDQAVLTLLDTRSLIRDKYPRIGLDDSMEDIMKTVSESTVAVFPVLDKQGRFQGMLEMDDIRKHLFDKSGLDRIYVRNLMHAAPEYVYEDEKMDSVMRKFERTDAWRLPVITQNHIYLGFISRSRILTAYRERLKQISTED